MTKRSPCIVVTMLGFLLAIATSARAEDITTRPPNVKDPEDRKAVIAVVRAAKAVSVDLQKLRLVVSPNCGCGGAYAGQGLFIADENFLRIPQWALDALMAHEMGHAIKRHVETGALRDAGIIGGLAVLGAILDDKSGAKSGAEVGQVVVAFTRPKFTQAQEYEADAVGVKILGKEGYKKPGDTMAAMLDLFGRDTQGGGWFDTHPSTPDRIRKLRGR